ncbi:single-stranded DNA-binding protein [Lake Baikal phage Baikal-20-5m-C28]|nr:single-stranded DNA-binding protein [Lake Baikal phage Baikal-20-5m-C28]
MSLANLKNNRLSDINRLVAAAEKVGGGATQQSFEDNRMWKPEVDKAGNGFAVLRFLPAPEGDDYPWARYWDHGFQGPGGWYIERSLTSIGGTDPVSELNSKLWNSGLESDKDIARKQKRRLHHVSNVMIISDPAHPENEGKVFLFQYGKKIYDKMMDVMQPQFQDESPINPFDLWTGANFKLKIRNVEGYRNYDKSEFDKASAVANGDEAELEKIYAKCYSLKEFTDPSTYKSYDELKAKLSRVLGGSAPRTTAEGIELDEVRSSPKVGATLAAVSASAAVQSDGDDDTLSYFSKLANEA